MNLERIEIYKLDGRDFRTIASAREHIEGEIGKILDQTPLRMHPKQALDVFTAIVKNKDRLRELLSIEVEREDFEPINLLDA